mmetsp:Transcript_8106/g.12019  ORF Transcript_8106/g.12019 Transcript_8106/m.12019 type:complete len:365 (+) Transcript_8106:754-1848(+)
MVLPSVCFASLVFGSERLRRKKYEGITAWHSVGFLCATRDRVELLFQMVGTRTLSWIKSRGRVETLKFREQGDMMEVEPVSPRLILKRVFEKVSKRGSSLREVFEQILRNKNKFRLRWADFEEVLEREGHLGLKGCAIHEGYARGQLDVDEAVRLTRCLSKRIECIVREKCTASAFLRHGIRLNALSSGSAGFIQGIHASGIGTMLEAVKDVLDMAFYSERTPYVLLKETLDPAGADFEAPEMIEKALKVLLNIGPWPLAAHPQTPSSGHVADELVDWTEAAKFLRRVALFWFLLALPASGRGFNHHGIPGCRVASEFWTMRRGLMLSIADMGLRLSDLTSMFSWSLERHIELCKRVLIPHGSF